MSSRSVTVTVIKRDGSTPKMGDIARAIVAEWFRAYGEESAVRLADDLGCVLAGYDETEWGRRQLYALRAVAKREDSIEALRADAPRLRRALEGGA
jgi:hypothetical protein